MIKMKDIGKILQLYDRVLIDGCLRGTGRVLGDQVSKAENYHDLDVQTMFDESEKIRKFLFLLSNRNIITVPGVPNEYRPFDMHLANKLNYLNDSTSDFNSGRRRNTALMRAWAKGEPIKRAKRRVSEETTSIDLRRRQYHDLCNLSRDLIETLDGIAINFSELPGYNSLHGLVKFISEKADLKKDGDGIKTREEIYANDTDEAIVAASYYLSMLGEKTLVLTSDCDFFRLMAVVPRMIGADKLLPENARFREAFRHNEPNLILCHPNTSEYNKIDFNDRSFYRNLNIRGISDEENTELRKQARDNWQKFEKEIQESQE